MPHCKGQICLEIRGECICLCQPCADVKRAEGQDICPVCNRTYDEKLPAGYTHFDGSICQPS